MERAVFEVLTVGVALPFVAVFSAFAGPVVGAIPYMALRNSVTAPSVFGKNKAQPPQP